MGLAVTGIFRYPIKSCRGAAVATADVEPWGLAGDRRWMLVDGDGAVITARECHRLLLVTPTITPDGLSLRSPDLSPLDVAVPADGPLVPVTVWSSQLEATEATADASAWFSKLTGQPTRLVYLDDPSRRATNPAHSHPGDRVSLADGYPLLAATEASMAALNDLIAAGPRAAEGPLPIARFRPNVVIKGTPAWGEDDWRLLRIGAVTFRAAKGCARCVMTTLDPDTAAGGKEPIATLARHRRWDGQTWFGVNLIPDDEGRIAVGDPVEILHAEAAGGPIR